MKKLFTVYDSKADFYLYPFATEATGLAVRSFETAVNDSAHEFNRYAADYTLFEIGEWDEQNCSMRFLESKINLGNGIQFLQPDPSMAGPAAGKAAKQPLEAMTKPNGGYSVPVKETTPDYADLTSIKGVQK